MKDHLHALSWPSDLATPDAGFMIVRESTHRASLLSQHRATIGIRIPLLVSALGRAWLGWCNDEEREATLALLRLREDTIGVLARDSSYVQKILRETRKRGYALNRSEWATEVTVVAIGFPIMERTHAIGAMNLVLQHNAVTERGILKKYVPRLRALAEDTSEKMRVGAISSNSI